MQPAIARPLSRTAAVTSSRLASLLSVLDTAALPAQQRICNANIVRLQSTSAASGSAKRNSPQGSPSAAGGAKSSPAQSSPLPEDAPLLLDADARIKRRLVPAGDRINGLSADPYGWAPEDRTLKEAPLWMVMEAEREEVRLPKQQKRARADSERVGALLDVPQIDAQGRAYATGRRKTSAARVWVSPGSGEWRVNGKALCEYFPRLVHRTQAMEAFVATQSAGAFDIMSTVHGGGLSGQAGALKHGVAKALAAYDPLLRPVLKQLGLLYRDPRMVERKKPGQKKARKKFQWVKR